MILQYIHTKNYTVYCKIQNTLKCNTFNFAIYFFLNFVV